MIIKTLSCWPQKLKHANKFLSVEDFFYNLSQTTFHTETDDRLDDTSTGYHEAKRRVRPRLQLSRVLKNLIEMAVGWLWNLAL